MLPKSTFPIDEAEAIEVLLPQWEQICEIFEEHGHMEPSEVSTLVVTPDVHDTCRHFAATRDDGKVVYVAPEMCHLPLEVVAGVLAHEAGHVVDMRNPGIFWFRYGDLCAVEELPTKRLRKHLREWGERSDDEIERVADAIATEAIGTKIGYVGPPYCLVQAVGRGIRRPKGLR
ncbi:MAG: hypothetical protein ACYTEQ_05165 [Planctomycetota bacterium]|jgi:hypothetical protein